MSLALRSNTAPARVESAPVPAMTLEDVWKMAVHVSASRLFGATTPEQAFTLMMISQAEGIHPIQAMRRFHIMTIGGKTMPSMRSDAVQGEMIAHGWSIKPVRRDAKEARALFAHPTRQPEGFEMGVTIEQYRHLAGKDVWKNHPDDMLWARLVTKACRTLDPGLIVGIYSPEELSDMDAYASPAVQIAQQQHAALEAVRTADVPVIGCDDLPLDAPYSQVIKTAVEETNRQLKEFGAAPLDVPSMHKMLCNSTLAEGLETVMPASTGPAVKLLSRVYGTHRDWLRKEIDQQLRAYIDEYRAVDTTATPVEATTADANADPDADYPPEPGSDG